MQKTAKEKASTTREIVMMRFHHHNRFFSLLCHELHCDEKTAGKILRGHRDFPVEDAVKIARLLHLPVRTFLGEEKIRNNGGVGQ